MANLQRNSSVVLAAAAAVFSFTNSAYAGTPCCAGEPHGTPKALTGLGQPTPPSADVSESAAWSAYELERDGIQYLQVDDPSGKVRVIIGNIGETFWSLPAGSAADRVSLPQSRLSIPVTAKRMEVYRRPGVVLAAYEVDGGIIWSIEAPDGTR